MGWMERGRREEGREGWTEVERYSTMGWMERGRREGGGRDGQR